MFISYKDFCKRIGIADFDDLSEQVNHMESLIVGLPFCFGVVDSANTARTSASISWEGFPANMSLKYNNKCAVNTKVAFFVGLSDTGINAHGVRPRRL